MSSSNPSSGQHASELSTSALMTALHSSSNAEKIKARIISTDRLMSLLQKKRTECDTLKERVAELEAALAHTKRTECDTLKERVAELEAALAQEQTLRKEDGARLKEQLEDERLEMQIENDMLKGDLDEKETEIEKLRSQVSSAPQPQPPPSSPVPVAAAPEATHASAARDDSQILQEIRKLQEGMRVLQDQFSKHVECPQQMMHLGRQLISDRIPTPTSKSATPSSAPAVQQDTTVNLDTILRDMTPHPPNQTSEVASSGAATPHPLRRVASSPVAAQKQSDRAPLSELHEQRPRVASTIRAEPPRPSVQRINGLIVPQPNMNRVNNVRDHVVSLRDMRKTPTTRSKTTAGPAARKEAQMAPSTKRKMPDSQRDPDPVRVPRRPSVTTHPIQPTSQPTQQRSPASPITSKVSPSPVQAQAIAPGRSQLPQQATDIIDKIAQEEPEWVMNHLTDIRQSYLTGKTDDLKALFDRLEVFYEKLQSFSSLNLKNAKVQPYGPAYGIMLKCPMVIHVKEQKMAWFLYVLGLENKSLHLIPQCVQWASKLAINAVKARKVGQACRYARLITLICKNTDHVEPVQIFCYDVLRAIRLNEAYNVNYGWILLNVAVVWKEALEFSTEQTSGGADLIVRSIQSATMELCRTNPKYFVEIYNPLVNACGWPFAADSITSSGRLSELVTLLSQPEIKLLANTNKETYDTLLFNIRKAFELSMYYQQYKEQRRFVQETLWPMVVDVDVMDIAIDLIACTASFGIVKKTQTRGRKRRASATVKQEEEQDTMSILNDARARFRTILGAKSFTEYDIKLQTAAAKGLLRISCDETCDKALVGRWSNNVASHFRNSKKQA